MSPESSLPRRVDRRRAQEIFAKSLAAAASGDFPGFAWLDGGARERSFIGLEPDLVIEGDDLGLLDRIQESWRSAPDQVWIGWLSYDVGVDTLLGRRRPLRRLPGLSMRRFSRSLELAPTASGWIEQARGEFSPFARVAGESFAAAQPRPPARVAATAWPLGRLSAALSAADYRARVCAALGHIAAGETYQVNLSQRFHADWTSRQTSLADRAARVYAALRAETPAVMGALIQVDPTAWIVSNSPETLLDVRGATGRAVARSWPIKGTRARADDPADDLRAIAELESSGKELAEHVMIVDLVRNDLGRVAVPGTVRAPARPEVVSLPTVHHLVSEVRCDLPPQWRLVDLVRAVFPGGSVTGAPKRRTVEIIDELEAEERGIYCGAILLLEPGGMRISIPIRTGVLTEAGLELRSGGGIVIDSDPEAERLETWAKVRAFDPTR